MNPVSEVFTTLRFDKSYSNNNPIYLVEYHVNRLETAAAVYNFNFVKSYKDKETKSIITKAVHDALTSLPKYPDVIGVRIGINKAGELNVTTRETPAKNIQWLLPTSLPTEDVINHEYPELLKTIMPIYISKYRTQVTPYLRYKTNDREIYNKARDEVKDKSPGEVLLVNTNGNLLDGSISTVYIFRGGKWRTPRLEDGALEGVSRRYATTSGVATEEAIAVEDLKQGELVWLSNGMRGFWPGKININS